MKPSTKAAASVVALLVVNACTDDRPDNRTVCVCVLEVDAAEMTPITIIPGVFSPPPVDEPVNLPAPPQVRPRPLPAPARPVAVKPPPASLSPGPDHTSPLADLPAHQVEPKREQDTGEPFVSWPGRQPPPPLTPASESWWSRLTKGTGDEQTSPRLETPAQRLGRMSGS